MHRTYARSFSHDSRRRQKLPETIFLTVNFLNKREIPHRLQSHNERILRTARRPYDALTAVAQRKNHTYGQMSLQRTGRSRTTHALPDVPTTC